MDPAKPNRNAEFRAAIASVIVGGWMLVQAVLSHLDGMGGGAWTFGVLALLFLGLAVPVYRGSDGAALTVVGVFALLMIFALLAGGVRALLPWPLIMAVVLGVGMYGVLVQNTRSSVVRVRRR